MYDLQVQFGEIERYRKPGMHSIIWYVGLGEFDFNYPFRETLDRLRRKLEMYFDDVELIIEDWYELEDFIHFSLKLDSEKLPGYFEHSLSFLELSHPDENLLSQIRTIGNEIKFQLDKKTNGPDEWEVGG